MDLTVAEVSSNATVTTPGAPNAVLAFTVTNTGNAQQGYALTFLEEVGTTLFGNADNANFGNLVIRVDEDPSSGNGTGNDTYDGTETATAIDRLNPNQQVTVFIVSPVVPLTLVNANFANVNLTARVAVPGTNGATLVTQSTGANNPAVVEIVFADDPSRHADATESAVDQFAIQSAALTVTKAQTVISDGFSSANPRAIPDAIVEYTIMIANGSTTTAASDVAISDPIPANTTFVSQRLPGPATLGLRAAPPRPASPRRRPIRTRTGASATQAATSSSAARRSATIAAGATVSVQFRVQIN